MRKTTLLLLTLLFVASLLPAQVHLVGLKRTSTSVVRVDALRWDVLTGAVLDSLVTQETGANASSSCFDASTGSYYFHSGAQLVRVAFDPDSVQGLGPVQMIQNAEFDMSNGRLFGVEDDIVYDSAGNMLSSTMHFLRHDLQTGLDSTLLTLVGSSGTTLRATTFDANAGEYYILTLDGQRQIQLLRISTRGVVTATPIPQLDPSQSIFSFEYDNQHDILYALRVNSVPSPAVWELVRIDPVDGTTVLEASFPQFYGMSGSGFDQTTGTLIMMVSDSNFNHSLQLYDVQTGLLSQGFEPHPFMEGFEVDNAAFAAHRYGATAIQAPTLSSIALYPNPATDVLRINATTPLKSYQVIDLSGRILASGGGADEISVADLTPGLYVLQGQARDGSLSQGKFVKR